MTPRSPNQYPKTSTISRRLRTRADQNLSVQPPEIPQFRNVRPHRAANSPTRRLTSLKSETPESHRDHQHDQPVVTSISAQGTDAPRGVTSRYISLAPSQSGEIAAYASIEISRGQGNVPENHNFGAIQTGRSHPPPSPLLAGSDNHELEVQLTSDPIQSHTPFVELQDMSTLGYMMAPSQYSMHHYGAPSSYSSNYPPNSHQGYVEHRSPTAGPYESSYGGGAILAHEQRRHDDHSVLPPYASQQPSHSRSPYQQHQEMGSMRSNSVPTASNPQNFAYSAPHGSVPNQPLGSNASTYPPPPLYPPTTYGVSEYHPLPTMYPPSSTTPAAYPSYDASTAMNHPSPTQISSLSSSPGAQSSAVMPRILNSRPKPQCWEHGCNGRQFSTFSNLLRHQREKSGTASKSYCPRCGAEFTRTTARNGHMAHDKCKPRRPSDADR